MYTYVYKSTVYINSYIYTFYKYMYINVYLFCLYPPSNSQVKYNTLSLEDNCYNLSL